MILPDVIRGWPIHRIMVYIYITIHNRSGELQYTRDGLARELGISPQKLRTSLARLEDDGYVKNLTSKQGSKVQLTNINQQLTNTHPDTQQVTAYINQHQPTITNEVPSSSSLPLTNSITITTSSTNTPTKERLSKESTKKGSSIDTRMKKFYDSLVPYVEEFGAEMVRAFYDYWTEPNKSNTKFKMELQQTWDTKRRLNTWRDREAKSVGHRLDTGVIINNTSEQDYEPW